MPLGRRRKTAAAHAAPVPEKNARLERVIVSRSLMESRDVYDNIQAVLNYFDACVDFGLLKLREIPPEAVQAYYAIFYLFEVENGGHDQFLFNGRANLDDILPAVRAALPAMGAERHAALFEQACAWHEKNSAPGFPGEPPEVLDELDSRFFDLEKIEPLTSLSSAWIRSWPMLQILEDDRCDRVYREMGALNPLYASRKIAARIRGLDLFLQEDPYFSLALALNNWPGDPIILEGVGSGVSRTIWGRQEIGWSIKTTSGVFTGFSMADGAVVLDASGPGKARIVGNLARQPIEEMRASLKEIRFSAAVDLLLQESGLSSEAATPVSVTPSASLPGPLTYHHALAAILAKGSVYRIRAGEGFASLHDWRTDKHLALVNAEQILAHSSHRDV